MQVSVIGGSLGGLTAALLLRDLGMTVHVYERSSVELTQRGAGIGFLPESQRYLVERAGVNLDEISVATSHIRYLDRQARVIYDGAHHYRFSSWTTVYRQLLKCIDPASYHLDHEMTAWESGDEGIRVHFSGRPSHRADLLICADGAGSAARLPEPMANLVQALAKPFLQVIYDIDIPRMAFGMLCLLGDAAFVKRPHAAAGTAKAADDARGAGRSIVEGERSEYRTEDLGRTASGGRKTITRAHTPYQVTFAIRRQLDNW